MKTSRFLLAGATALLMHTFVSLSYGQVSDGIAAVVNGKVITRSEVRQAVSAQEQLINMTIQNPAERQAKLSELRESSLHALIERQLVLSEFDKLGGTIKSTYVDDDVNSVIRDNFGGNREKFLQELARNGMTMKKFRDQREKMMIVSVLRARQTKSLPPPTPAQVEEFYRKNDDKFRETSYIKFSTITIPKYPIGDSAATPESQKKLAEEIRSKAVGGGDFATLARTYSQDSRADVGGDWGMQERATLSREIADIVFTLKQGTVSKVIEIGVNYMVIYVEALQPGKLEPLEKVRPQIEKVIKSEMGREALNRWLTSLGQKSNIQPENVRKEFLDWAAKHK